ncbi:hypothetical protein QAD02_018440 [Eretmocerus hayati]|uniref:Uncharacterized protein n=1 Tax=Eretmocerus hayati TaxID=131215 RepID=A0ACC2PHY0_9HYME|nr:hypothetical protein QAD02_018440 [Eretmocerus hayati]
MAPPSDVPRWALVNYLLKNLGEKSLQIVEVDDIKNFNPLTFAPERKDPKTFLFSVALLNTHKEKVYHAAERLRESGADDNINERDGEVPPNKKLKVQDKDNCADEEEPLISDDDRCDDQGQMIRQVTSDDEQRVLNEASSRMPELNFNQASTYENRQVEVATNENRQVEVATNENRRVEVATNQDRQVEVATNEPTAREAELQEVIRMLLLKDEEKSKYIHRMEEKMNSHTSMVTAQQKFTENEIEEFKKEENGMAPMSEVQVQDEENNRWVTRFHTRYGQVMHPKTWASLQEIYGSAFLRAYLNVTWPTELMGNRALAVDRAQRQVYKRSPRRPFTPRKVAGVKEVYFEHIDNLNIDEKRKKKMKKKWSTVFSSAMSVAHTKLYKQGEDEN